MPRKHSKARLHELAYHAYLARLRERMVREHYFPDPGDPLITELPLWLARLHSGLRRLSQAQLAPAAGWAQRTGFTKPIRPNEVPSEQNVKAFLAVRKLMRSGASETDACREVAIGHDFRARTRSSSAPQKAADLDAFRMRYRRTQEELRQLFSLVGADLERILVECGA
jgi:hypothetical protein